MRLRLDITNTQFLVTRAAEPRLNFDTGAPRIDPDSGLALHSVQVLALDETGGEVLNVTVVGDSEGARDAAGHGAGAGGDPVVAGRPLRSRVPRRFHHRPHHPR